MVKKVIFITIITFAVFFFVDEFLFKTIRLGLEEILHQRGISHILAYTLVGTPIFAGVLLMHKKQNFFDSLGLNRSLFIALLFALLCILPLFLVYFYLFGINTNLTFNLLLVNVIAAGFFEELYFRGFIFGQFYRYTRIGFLLSVFLGALLYGIFHLFLGSDVVEFALVFLLTFIGGLIFSWFYAEWNYNLWVPVFLHMFVNLSWEMFAVDAHPRGDFYANLFRILTICFAIVLTVIYKKRNRKSLEISREKLFYKQNNGTGHLTYS